MAIPGPNAGVGPTILGSSTTLWFEWCPHDHPILDDWTGDNCIPDEGIITMWRLDGTDEDIQFDLVGAEGTAFGSIKPTATASTGVVHFLGQVYGQDTYGTGGLPDEEGLCSFGFFFFASAGGTQWISVSVSSESACI